MAKIEILAPFLLSFEGGFVNHKDDKGGATNMGVTLKTWREVGYDKDNDGDIDVDDLVLVTKDDVIYNVLEPFYWNRCWASRIENQNVANMLVDWAYNSGVKTAIRAIQRIVGVVDDGIMGLKTISAINDYDASELFASLKNERIKFVNAIVAKNPSQKVFLKGWMRRIESINFGFLTYNDGSVSVL